MLKWIYSNLTIGLSSQAFVLLQDANWWRKTSFLETHNFESTKTINTVQNHCEQIASVIQEKKMHGSSAELVLSDELVRQWIVEPPQNVVNLEDLKAAAAARFQVLFGDSASVWQIEADWKFDSPFLASAISKNLAVAIDGLAKKCQLQWKQIAPHSVVLFNRWRNVLPAHAWITVYQNGRLSFLVTNEKKVVGAYRHISCEVDDISSEKNFINLLNREALRMNLPSPKHVYFSRVLNEFNWLMHTTNKDMSFKVLNIFNQETTTMTSAIDLALSGV